MGVSEVKSNKVRSFAGKLVLSLGLLMGLPAFVVSAQAQDGYWGNQDRRERRQERRERRQERREERREERQERRAERRGRNWDRYDNYGGSFQLRQTALNAGYNEGIEEGRNDRRRGERFNYSDESDYRNASKDYSSRLGDRSLYQRYFREGFANGYEDGYRGY